MLVKCAICRWLTTGQLKRLFFPEATLNAVQKRLRKLVDGGYLRAHREHATAESIHAVGPKGRTLVEAKGIEVASSGEVPRQMEHLLGVNDIRIAVEQNAIPVSYFFAYWQLSNLGWSYPAIPDALFEVLDPEHRTFLVEYDRGTETLDKLFEKLRRYAGGLEDFPFEAVLLLTEERRRLDLLARAMRRKGVSVLVLVATMEEIRQSSLFEMAFVELPRGAKRKVLEPRREEAELQALLSGSPLVGRGYLR